MLLFQALFHLNTVAKDALQEARRRRAVVTLRLQRFAVEVSVLTSFAPHLHTYREEKRAAAAKDPVPNWDQSKYTPWTPTARTVWHHHQRQLLEVMSPGYLTQTAADGTITIVLECRGELYEFHYMADGTPLP